ncbi:hypothetical protein [Lentzea kentuckyensis]|uniref:hypothetical protein n=1 Tax=Lentzea kentuckyensis TaxID=360086 RepID=UPI00117B0367|nr:hypothetical protein [Lentzea kentuckyensis]
MTTNSAEVVLTSTRSALGQRVVAGFAFVATLAGMVALAFAGGPWWAILLGELGLLVTVLFCAAIWSSAGSDAKETVALRATGTVVLAEVRESIAEDDGDSVMHLLRLWIPVSGDGFEVHHRCRHYGGEQQVKILVDPATRTWGALH